MILEIEEDDVMIHRIMKTMLLSESLIFLSRNNICFNIHMKMNECSSYVVIRKCLLSLSWYRISENTSFLFLHISLFFVGLKPKLTDLTITHLAIVHIMILLIMRFLSTDIWWHGISKVTSNVEWLSSLRYWGDSLLVHLPLKCASGHHHQPQQLLTAKFKLKSQFKLKFKLKSHPVFISLLIGPEHIHL